MARCHTVYNDHAGRAGTSENGLPGSSDADCDSGCSAAGRKRVPAKRLTSIRSIITIKKYWITSERGDRWHVPAGKWRNERVHEGTETTEIWKILSPVSPCTVRDRWISFHSILRERTIRSRSLMTARSWSRSLRLLTAVSSIRNRLCRSYVILPDTHWDEATFCAVPCPRKRAT